MITLSYWWLVGIYVAGFITLPAVIVIGSAFSDRGFEAKNPDDEAD